MILQSIEAKKICQNQAEEEPPSELRKSNVCYGTNNAHTNAYYSYA